LDANAPQPKRLRLRFNLKLVFVAITALAIFLGYQAARERALVAMFARHDAVLNQLSDNSSTAPDGTSFPQFRSAPLNSPASSPGRNVQHGSQPTRGIPVPTRGLSGSSATGKTLLIPNGSPLEAPGNRVLPVLRHYERGLKAIGMTRNAFSHSASNTEESAEAMWTMESHDIVVLIDIRTQNDEKRIRVRVRFIESQKVLIWQ
jgi:hypothetical protein